MDIPQEVIDLMDETAESHMIEVVSNMEPTLDIINGDFPVAVPFEERYYKAEYVVTILCGEFIVCLDIDSLHEISSDEFLDMWNSTRNHDLISFGCN